MFQTPTKLGSVRDLVQLLIGNFAKQLSLLFTGYIDERCSIFIDSILVYDSIL